MPQKLKYYNSKSNSQLVKTTLEHFPIPSALVSITNLCLADWNTPFAHLFGLSHASRTEEQGQQICLETLFKGHIPEIQQYLKRLNQSEGLNSNQEGIIIKTTAKQTPLFLRIQAQRLTSQESDLFIATFQDITTLKQSMSYFEDTFDQFMQTTIDLEEALSIIEKQKNEIERIHQELKRSSALMERDLELGRILQNAMINEVPQPPNWTIHVFNKPMAVVSGDIYDFYKFEDQNYTGLILLDASGHGVSSALITAIASPLFYQMHKRLKTKKLNRVIQVANRELSRLIGDLPNYLCGISMRIYPDRVTYVNAGHPHILHYSHKQQQIYELANSPLLLGVPEMNTEPQLQEITAEFEDSIFLYTDGLTEARTSSGEELGLERLKQKLVSLLGRKEYNPQKIEHELLAWLESWDIDVDNLEDDMSFIILHKSH